MSIDQSFAVATHALVMLAFSSPSIVSATAIAEELSLSPAVIRRTMTRLVKAGLVTSVAGPHGGYQLHDENISLATIYLLLHGDRGIATQQFEVPVSTCAEGLIVDRIVGDIYAKVDSAAAQVFEEWTIKKIKNTAKKRLTSYL